MTNSVKIETRLMSHMEKRWVLFGLFISLPEKEETWTELKSYQTYEEAILNASNSQNGIIVNGYVAFKIIERTYNDKIVFDSHQLHDGSQQQE